MAMKASPAWQAMHVKAAELLRDGNWHDYESVRRQVMRVVPAGLAIRRNEDDRKGQRARHGLRVQPRSLPAEEAQLIMYGQKAEARELLNMKLYYERRQRGGPEEPIKEIRMRRVAPAALEVAELEAYAEAARRRHGESLGDEAAAHS